MIKFMSLFVSKKIMSRMVLCKEDWDECYIACGGVAQVPIGFGDGRGTNADFDRFFPTHRLLRAGNEPEPEPEPSEPQP